jgi:hypothetical protein
MGRPGGEPSEFDQGRAAGEIAERLRGHDQHLARINGSMDRVADRLEALVRGNQELVLAVQRLGDAASSDRATVLTTAKALKDADDVRRDKTETRWSPMTRLLAVIGTLAALIAAIVAYIGLH